MNGTLFRPGFETKTRAPVDEGMKSPRELAELGQAPNDEVIPAPWDGWASYRELECDHALCIEHHLREPTFIHGQCLPPWAKRMIDPPAAAHHETNATPGRARTSARIQAIRADYEAILIEGAVAQVPLATIRRCRLAQRVGAGDTAPAGGGPLILIEYNTVPMTILNKPGRAARSFPCPLDAVKQSAKPLN